MENPPKADLIGTKINIAGTQYKVIEELADHWLIITNTGVWPANPLVIPKERQREVDQ